MSNPAAPDREATELLATVASALEHYGLSARPGTRHLSAGSDGLLEPCLTVTGHQREGEPVRSFVLVVKRFSSGATVDLRGLRSFQTIITVDLETPHDRHSRAARSGRLRPSAGLNECTRPLPCASADSITPQRARRALA